MNQSIPLVYAITDRRKLTHPTDNTEHTYLIEFIDLAFAAGIDMVQIREPDLVARELLALTERAVEATPDRPARMLINDRADIAGCTGAGVHLTTRSLLPEVVRKTFGGEMVIGVSTHSLNEAKAAEHGGADFVVLGPIFETESKVKYGSPLGLELLNVVAMMVSIPVLALGGITADNYVWTLEAGAAGVAGISMFSGAADLEQLVGEIKRNPVSRFAERALNNQRMTRLRADDYSVDHSGI